jgi:two-component system cell cycle response regulator
MSGRVLVVDDVASNRLILSAKLRAAYYDVITAEDGPGALAIAAEQKPDLILLDVMMPGMNGYEVCRRLKRDPQLAHIPVVMVTALGDREERMRGLTIGADDLLSKPYSDLELFARARNLIRMKMMVDELRLRDETTRALGLDETELSGLDNLADGGEVVVISADRASAAMRAETIAVALGARVSPMTDGRAALEAAERNPPDAIVIDRSLGAQDSGMRLIAALRGRPATRQSALIMVIDSGDLDAAASALDIGANDYVMEPFELSELVVRLRSQIRRKRYSDRLRDSVQNGLMMAVIDPLTGLYNRRYASSHLANMQRAAAEAKSGIGVMMLDLDKFKLVNDRYGHEAGDRVLKEFARRLRANVRGVDLVARLGGEEFFLAMPDADKEEASIVAERIRSAVEAEPFNIGDGGAGIRVTVSIGVTMGKPGEQDSEHLIRRADAALYESKSSGRNRVTFDIAA